jgi:proline racemase
MKNWRPPKHWLKITSIDAHTEGEPFRVITGRHEFLIAPMTRSETGFC